MNFFDLILEDQNLTTYNDYLNANIINAALNTTYLFNEINEENNIQNNSLYDQSPYKKVILESELNLIKEDIYDGSNCLNDYCCFTQENFIENKTEISILPCKHGFSKYEIKKWLTHEQHICPICRYEFKFKEVSRLSNSTTQESNNTIQEFNNITNVNPFVSPTNNPIIEARQHFFNNLLRLNNTSNYYHPFGTRQIYNTIPHSYLDDFIENENDNENDIEE
jgi:hypothetical protein